MKNRTEEVWSALSSLVEERGVHDLEQTMSSFPSHAGPLLDDLRYAFLACNKQALSWQQKGEKDETSFIAFSFLDTSILTDSYDLRIDFYDARFLKDIAESAAYFSYAYLIPPYQKSVEVLCAEADKHFVRFMDYEADALAWKYKNEVLYKMVLTTCSLCLFNPNMKDFWPSLTVARNCVFTFGRLHNDQQLYMMLPRPQEVTA